MSFHEVRFPTSIALGSTAGPERRTEIVVLGSGREERNSRWADSRRRFNAGYGVKTLDDLYAVIDFFEERRGRLYGFRFKDFTDFRSAAPQSPPTAFDQNIGTGDGTTTTFQLVKTYGTTFAPYARPIVKPVAGSVLVAVDGVALAEGVDFNVDSTTGQITFEPAAVPAAGQAITAGFEFDVPVRFDLDELEINLSHFEAGQIPSIPIVEIRP